MMAQADEQFRLQVQELVHAFVDAVKDLVPAVSHAWRHLVQFGTLVETMASFSIWTEVMTRKDMVALLLHLYLGQMSPGSKAPQLPKVATMGTSNPWPNGRMEPNCDAMLRGIQILYKWRQVSSVRWPPLSEQMFANSLREMVQKLCTTDPMGGSGGGVGRDKGHDPLIISIWHFILQHEGSKSGLAEQIRQQLLEQLEKQATDPASRARQSQSAQVLVRFLRGADTAIGDQGKDAQMLHEIRLAKEQLMQSLVRLECYRTTRNLGFIPAKRIAQVLVLALALVLALVLVLAQVLMNRLLLHKQLQRL